MKCEFCGKESELLCDFPKSSVVSHVHRQGFSIHHITCDNHMCQDCATSIATEIDYCPDCMEHLRGLKKNGDR
jgi:hypothetical protein